MGEIQAIRGTKDILPAEVGYWQWLEETASRILGTALYQEIRTPIFEQTQLFERGIGEATDVVGKEMYSFLDRGQRSLTLRPEGTAGVVRAYIEHKLQAAGGVQRLWYKGPMFRYERPQAGRQRQFHQIGVELLGTDDPRADVEVITLASEILKAVGLETLKLDLNSLGNAQDRQNYRQALLDYLTPYKADLDADSQQRLEKNPLRILDSKDEKTKIICENAPSILEHLGSDSQKHFERVQSLLTDLGVIYNLNPCLVRGLDYYTHTAFEIQSDDLGAQATVCGGGRYDGLIAQLGGPDTPAVGWAIGLERLIILLQQKQSLSFLVPDFYLVSKGEKAEARSVVLAQQLRGLGFSVELDLSGSAFGKQFKRADRAKAVGCIILGDAEAENGTVQLKWMATQEQISLTQADLLTQARELKAQISRHKS
ncbi:MAG: histidine--tRNA ligase [Microcystis panniformis Mp_MB_F_20051200_S9]|uniref:Histidine--tRNA ligase n=1 Tax=Microcystis panniformis Mp_MB_F_20051200_S9 TaxID=2486223 RepID=A0A552PRM7_9CHRO|nr:MAG: histidine--tRNA ligase [Microcystis panniformis Mp_GB_SS_20050300_S99]TRV50447.1 MAG: histidine--tRNA ligase [Microcystis panniformis Mp_MB_F_20080800_S26D]TRV51550.1 MAG: histidine--tRNA ligase [Microcystis panniformis Mp_GB_SS_20050300_S99D]TRV56339.1 MAG: histidine--tRNA ligase [Microcystis panniformis Mp_MB_F_20080800_S26]TRV59654.1 MAG: histidine--tRNA ligase [Microcystis panniformis Mp_MB_F_20051200_S9]TRV67080.1 MAG: histidine--tRNA ligase [Microcystis panniformis Mp_MB_F_200512